MTHYEKIALLMLSLAAGAGVLIGFAGFIFVLLTSGSPMVEYQQRLVSSIFCLIMGLLLYVIRTVVKHAITDSV